MKKLLLSFIISTMIFTTTSVSFGLESSNEGLITLSVPGFSYEIHGEELDYTDNYYTTLSYKILDDTHIKVITSNLYRIINTSVNTILSKSTENLYTGTLDDNITLNFEFREDGTPIFDIIKGDKVYAFGNNRRASIENYIEKLQAQDDATTFEKMPRYAGSVVKTASNSKVYMKAVWNPSKSNRLAIRINTQGNQVGTTVQGISITNGKVPSGYVVNSLNPTGANTSANFVNTLSYIINSTTFPVKLPSFSNKPVSSCNGRTFSFSVLGMGVSWNSLNSSADSVSGKNGMMFYVFLDDNLNTKPAPTGTVDIRYRIAGTGAFDAKLTF